MPTRIKPVYDLGPCILDSESIKGICLLVGRYYNQAYFGAEDDVWEVFDEPAQKFQEAIEDRKILDSFSVKAENYCPRWDSARGI